MKLLHSLFPVLLLLTASCSILGSGKREEATIYSPEMKVLADPAWPTVTWSLVVVRPSAPRVLDSSRISVRPTPGELQVYRGASWAQPATALLQNSVLRTLEDSGHIGAVASSEAGIMGDYRLVIDLRRFEADYAGQANPNAVIEFNAKLVRTRDQRVVDSRTFLAKQATDASDVDAVARAFDQALATVTTEVVGWTLTAGQADRLRKP